MFCFLFVWSTSWPPSFESVEETNKTLQAAIAQHPPFGKFISQMAYGSTAASIGELKDLGCHVSVGESFEKATNAIKKQKTEVTETLTKLSCDRIKLALGNPNFKSYNLPMTNATNKFVLKM